MRPQYARLTGERFTSFAALARAMHRCDVERAKGLDRTRAARTANRKRKGSK